MRSSGGSPSLRHRLSVSLCAQTVIQLPSYLILTFDSETTGVLTPWNTVLLAKLLSKFPAFYGTPQVHYRAHKNQPLNRILCQIKPGEILGSHGGEYEDGCLLACCAVQSGRSLTTFQRCLLPPSSGR
jgi:hypothetical protein